MNTPHEQCAARWQRLEGDVFELKSIIPSQFKALGAGIGIVHESTLRLERQVVEVRSDIAGLKGDVGGLRRDVTGLKQDMAEVKVAMSELLRRTEPSGT